jgi:hypothetical protein
MKIKRGVKMKIRLITMLLALLVAQPLWADNWCVPPGSGDMPFPIGKITDFPSTKIKGVWASSDLRSKLFKLTPVPKVPRNVGVQMLNIYKDVVAQGIGRLGDDEVLRATLIYMDNKNRSVDVKIANFCKDDDFDNRQDKNGCDESAIVISLGKPIDQDDPKCKEQSNKFYFLKKMNWDF